MTGSSPNVEIVARRFDGLGGRLNAMVNAMVIADLHGLDFRFAWIDSDDLSSNDPSELFEEEFLSQYRVDDADFVGRTSIELADASVAKFKNSVSSLPNSFLEVNWPIGLHPVLLALGDEGARRFSAAFRSIPLACALQPIFERLDRLKDEQWTGIHVRAGDVVSGPWRRLMWHEKYPVSPLLRRAISGALADGRRVVLVTDNPDYAEWLVSECPGAQTSADLLGNEAELTELQRMMADLLVLSRCETLVTSANSAFSTFATAIGDSTMIRLTETVTSDEARAVIEQGVHDQLNDRARHLLDPFSARDLVWFIDAFCDTEPARALLLHARTATLLDADFTSAWARRARLAARCGRFREAWQAVDAAETTAKDDQRQDDSAVDADLAVVVVGCLELIARGWIFSMSARARRLDRIDEVVRLCGTRRPHHGQRPAVAWVDELVAETRRRLSKSRSAQVVLAARTRRRLLSTLPNEALLTRYETLRDGRFDPFVLDVSGLVCSLAR